MAVSDEERRHPFRWIANLTDEQAARTMSEMFEEADDEDPGILARFDQQDAALSNLSGRLDGVERAVVDLRADFAAFQLQTSTELRVFRADLEGLLHREIGRAIASQTRTVLVGIVGVTASMFAMLFAMQQFL